MNTITVIFIGLIAHVNQPGSFDNTAVLMNALGHEPRIVIPAASVSTNPADTWLEDAGPPINGVYTIPIAGMRIELQGTRGTFCDHPDEVLEHVPRLRALTSQCGGLKRAVRNRQPTSKMVAYFDYRGGALQTLDYLRQQLTYSPIDGPSFTRCASCRLAYQGTLQGDDALLVIQNVADGATHRIKVPGNSEVRVENFPRRQRVGLHFGAFYELFNDCDDAASVAASSQACNKQYICNLDVLPFPFADCTNSQWP